MTIVRFQNQIKPNISYLLRVRQNKIIEHKRTIYLHHPVVDLPYSVQGEARIQVDGSCHRLKYVTQCFGDFDILRFLISMYNKLIIRIIFR